MHAEDVFPSPELRGWVESMLRAISAVEPRAARSKNSARVFLVRAKHGNAYLKVHAEPRRFEQERAFYEDVSPALGPVVPSLIGVKVEARAILLSPMDGKPVEALDAGWRARAFHEAGRFLGRLHGITVSEDDAMPVHEALLARLEALARDATSPELSDRLTGRRVALSKHGTRSLRRVICHRDFQPDNWLFATDAEPMLRVVDFEHSRLDLALFDLARLDLLHSRTSPEVMAAFWEGYGTPPIGEEATLYEDVKLMEAARTAIWAERHDDEGFRREAEIMWKALGRA